MRVPDKICEAFEKSCNSRRVLSLRAPNAIGESCLKVRRLTNGGELEIRFFQKMLNPVAINASTTTRFPRRAMKLQEKLYTYFTLKRFHSVT